MLDLKIACGHKCTNDAYFLQQFDRFTIDKNETVIGITKELVHEWCNGDKNIKDSMRYCKYLYLSQLSVYLNKIGIQSYVPRHSYKQPAYTPYIFSKEEIDKIFKEVDCLRSPNKNTFSVIFVMPALLRLLYSTGLRIGEALSLKNKDVNLVNRYIHTKDSKNGEERIIPISDSLHAVCEEYVSHKKNIPINQHEESLFFPNLQGGCCKRYTIGWNFRKVMTKAGIPYANNGHPPRVHDLRHTFACHSLASMIESGMDIYTTLPILSAYLGHKSLRATEKYVRLTVAIYPQLIKDVNITFLDVFPKIYNHENY
jgi:integrase